MARACRRQRECRRAVCRGYAPKEGGGTPGGGTVANRYDVGQTMVYTFEGLYNTDYEINVRSIDRFGNSSEAVSGSVSIGNFENRPPERTSERMADVSMPDTAETSIVSITLTPYFTDPDLEYGDETLLFGDERERGYRRHRGGRGGAEADSACQRNEPGDSDGIRPCRGDGEFLDICYGSRRYGPLGR